MRDTIGEIWETPFMRYKTPVVRYERQHYWDMRDSSGEIWETPVVRYKRLLWWEMRVMKF